MNFKNYFNNFDFFNLGNSSIHGTLSPKVNLHKVSRFPTKLFLFFIIIIVFTTVFLFIGGDTFGGYYYTNNNLLKPQCTTTTDLILPGELNLLITHFSNIRS